jgi:hypothetical protein
MEFTFLRQDPHHISTVRYADIAARRYTNPTLHAANRPVGRHAE